MFRFTTHFFELLLYVVIAWFVVVWFIMCLLYFGLGWVGVYVVFVGLAMVLAFRLGF